MEADQQPTEADVLMAIGQQSEPAAAPTPKPDGETDAHGNRIVRNPDGSVKFMQDRHRGVEAVLIRMWRPLAALRPEDVLARVFGEAQAG